MRPKPHSTAGHIRWSLPPRWRLGAWSFGAYGSGNSRTTSLFSGRFPRVEPAPPRVECGPLGSVANSRALGGTAWARLGKSWMKYETRLVCISATRRVRRLWTSRPGYLRRLPGRYGRGYGASCKLALRAHSRSDPRGHAIPYPTQFRMAGR